MKTPSHTRTHTLTLSRQLCQGLTSYSQVCPKAGQKDIKSYLCSSVSKRHMTGHLLNSTDHGRIKGKEVSKVTGSEHRPADNAATLRGGEKITEMITDGS